MTEPLRLSIDAMGGDHGLTVTVAAAREALTRHTNLHLVLVGDRERVGSQVGRCFPEAEPRIEIRHASQAVTMDELPSKALRNKKDSSMRVALDLVKRGEATAAISAGNTGALMATAKFVLKTLPGIDRPAIISAIPSRGGQTFMLDLGANTECTAAQLFQFAVMGTALAEAEGVEHPRLALLNIGVEEMKGSEAIREAAALLSGSNLNYVGFVEGDGVFVNAADVVICDGFAGNVALKTGEGVARMIYEFMKEEFASNIWHKIAALAAYPALRNLKHRIDPRHYNGASLLGLNGIVVKSHGGADALAFASAIDVAVRESERDVPHRISELLSTMNRLTDAPRVAAG